MNRHAIWATCWLALAVLFLLLADGASRFIVGIGYALVMGFCVREMIINVGKAYKRWYDYNG